MVGFLTLEWNPSGPGGPYWQDFREEFEVHIDQEDGTMARA